MRAIPGKALATGAVAVLAVAAPIAARAAAAGPGPSRAATASPVTPRPGHVILVGIGGLRWSDISPTVTPRLWRLAGQGSAGALDVTGISIRSCPVDGWLTLNSAARASAPHPASGPCPATPTVTPGSNRTSGTPGPAQIPAFPALVSYNGRFSENPRWGVLATASGPGRCATAAGPGAALALATAAGRVASYLPAPSRLTPALLARCPLTVADLGNLPTAPGVSGQAGRASALRADDRRLAAIIRELPAAATLVVLAPADGAEPHLRVIIVAGPGYADGLLTASSTRQPGLVTLTDVTPTILGWLGRPVPAMVTGSPIQAGPRASLAGTVRTLLQQDAAAQVYRQTVTTFFLLIGFGGALLFGLIAGLSWVPSRPRTPGGQPARGPGHQAPAGATAACTARATAACTARATAARTARATAARTAGLWLASIPAGTILASLLPWWSQPHPAAVLYALTAAWAALIAAAALAGPWRSDPLGPPGMVAAVTLGVLAVDLMTGSHLERDIPFGLTPLGSGRFYGLGNSAVVIYAVAAVLTAAWLGGVLFRRRQRTAGLVGMAAITGLAAVVSGWPGFGAKAGGTIAMLPGFVLFLTAAAGIRITVRRLVLAAVSGLLLVALFALASYLLPVTGHSDIGAFAGQALHGQAGPILRRKISSNLNSLGGNPFVLVIPAALVLAGLVLAGLAAGWPAWLRGSLLARACRQIPLLGPALATSWLIAVLCWLAEDNGVMVPAFGAPFMLPLVVAIVCAPAIVTGTRRPPAAPGTPAGPGTLAAAPGTPAAPGTLAAAPGTPAMPGSPPGPGAGHDASQVDHETDAGTASGGRPGYR
jgi:hypothetical protein